MVGEEKESGGGGMEASTWVGMEKELNKEGNNNKYGQQRE